MATTSVRNDSLQLQSFAQCLKAWRSNRTRGQRIPAELWKAAAELARVHGLNRTASALKLNYYGLLRRLSSVQVQPQRSFPAPAFVELAPPALPVGLSEPGTLELVHASGTRLTLRLPNANPTDLLAVVQLFLRHRP